MRAFYFGLLLSLAILPARENRDIFTRAEIIPPLTGSVPAQISFSGGHPPEAAFISAFSKKYNLGPASSFKVAAVERDELGMEHHRLDQYYKGIRIADVQYILHLKEGRVQKANGMALAGIRAETRPLISREQALARALRVVGADSYMWEDKNEEAWLRKLTGNKDESYMPRGELLLTSGTRETKAENLRLVYRFDIYARKPMSRQWVDIDARSGEWVNSISRIHTADLTGYGNTPYYGRVAVTVSDSGFPSPQLSYWHPDTFATYDAVDSSWWCADTSLGLLGGYDNLWYQVLDTDPFNLDGTQPVLKFYQRYAVESPGGEPDGYDGWDGMNVRISTDNGESWQVLSNPDPAYTASSLYSFGFQHGEGTGIPGWAAENRTWHAVNFDLSAYAGKTVRLRFAFASDPAASTADMDNDWFGWQVDNITVTAGTDTLFRNSGSSKGMSARQKENLIAGNYRLRQEARGGVFTFDMKNGTSYASAVDFVSDDSLFLSSRDEAGVSAHYGIESTYDYFKAVHNRDSYDNQGSPLISYVHYDNGYFNAFWNGQFMTYGDGNNNSTPLTTIDICAHELAHGVTGSSAGLIYQNESGALNESFSDIFGTAVEFYTLGSAANWLIGEDVGTFRSMSDPTQYGDPDTYKGQNWYFGSGDNGGVHTNSAVQNKWFYLLTEGGSGSDDNGRAYQLNGIGIEKAAKIAYRSLTVYLQPSSQYFHARLGSINAAADLYGGNSPELAAVIEAWNAVGVYFPVTGSSLSITPDSLDLVAEWKVSADTGRISIANAGMDSLTISRVWLSGELFNLMGADSLPRKIAFPDTLHLQIVYEPRETGQVVDTLFVEYSDSLGKTEMRIIRGTGYEISAAEPGQVYGVTRSASFFTVDSSGRGSLVGDTGLEELYGLSIHPQTGQLYTIHPLTYGTEFMRIDAVSGKGYRTSSLDYNQLYAFSFDPASGFIYSLNYYTRYLLKIDVATGSYEVLGRSSVSKSLGMAVNPRSGKLYAVDGESILYRVSKTDGATVMIDTIDAGNIRDLAFDGDGRLLALSATENGPALIYRINPATAQATLVDDTGQKGAIGLAVRGSTLTALEAEAATVPQGFKLEQNIPNPFNPATLIRYHLKKNTRVVLTVFDMNGKKIKTLVNSRQKAGDHRVYFNGGNLASGIYFYRLTAGGLTMTRRMLLLR